MIFIDTLFTFCLGICLLSYSLFEAAKRALLHKNNFYLIYFFCIYSKKGYYSFTYLMYEYNIFNIMIFMGREKLKINFMIMHIKY